MTVVLISPPLAKACEPLLGIATLKAVLETEGLECHCIDANVEAQEWLLSTARLDAAVARLMASDPQNDSVRRRTKSWPTLRTQVEHLKHSLRSSDGYRDENHYRTAVTSLNRLMAIASAGHNVAEGSPVAASLTDYKDTRYCDMDSTSVAACAKQPEQNLFHDYYAEVLIPRIRALNPTVIGLSLIFRNQLLCGVALAQMLREAFPEAHLTLGGELVSAWAPHLEKTDLLSCADSILPYEGEIGLLALAKDAPLEDVPNLCWRDPDGHYHRNPTQKLPHLHQIPAPDFSWAPWDLYFAPERTAPMVTARGCYWNRCTFCPEVINPERKLRLARVDRLTADMDRLYEEEGVTMFHFIDSALPPRTLQGIAKHVIENNRPYRWYGFSRLEPHLFRDGVAEELFRGGCRMLKLGLETASQRLLDAMDKNQPIDEVSRVLRALQKAGILVHGFLMFGTPFETEEDAEETRHFVAEHADCIQFINPSIMNLATGSPMAEAPEQHGITAVHPYTIPGHRLDLALYANFDCVGWGRQGARHYLQRVFLKDPAVRRSFLRTPRGFDSNHSVFFHPLLFPQSRSQSYETAA